MEENKETSKLTYEQLNQTALNLQQQLIEARKQLNNIDMTAMRLAYLFRVVENHAVFNKEFVDKCAVEIEEILTITTEETKEE